MLINAFRAQHLADIGHIAPQGRTGVAGLLGIVEADDERLTLLKSESLSLLAEQKRNTAARAVPLHVCFGVE